MPWRRTLGTRRPCWPEWRPSRMSLMVGRVTPSQAPRFVSSSTSYRGLPREWIASSIADPQDCEPGQDSRTQGLRRVVATFVATSRSSDASRSSRIVDVMDDLARNGRIGHLPDQVEGQVGDNRVEVRVLFGASQQSLAPRGFFVPAGRPATVEAVWLATAYGNWRQLVPPVPPPLDS